MGRGNSPLSVRELRPHFPDSPGGPDGSGPPGPFRLVSRPAMRCVGVARRRAAAGRRGLRARLTGVRPCDPWPSAVIAPAPAPRHHHASIGEHDQQLLSSAGKFFSQLASLSWVSLLIGLALYALYLLLRSRALFNAVRAAYPARARALARRVGRLHGRLRDQQRLPARRRQHRAAVPDPGRDPAQQLPDGRGGAVDRGRSSTGSWALLVMCFAFTQGVFPKPPDFSKLPAFDISFFASQHALHAVLPDRRWRSLFLVAFALLSARVRAFWQRIRQGLDDPARPPALPPRDGQLAVRQLDRPLRRLLGAARRVPHRRLGPQRAARARRCRSSPRCSRSRPAAPGVQQALLLTIFAQQPGRGGVLGRPADRHRGAHLGARVRARWCSSSASGASAR